MAQTQRVRSSMVEPPQRSSLIWNIALGGALIDAKVGESRSYTVPNGNTVKVTLVSAEPYHG